MALHSSSINLQLLGRDMKPPAGKKEQLLWRSVWWYGLVMLSAWENVLQRINKSCAKCCKNVAYCKIKHFMGADGLYNYHWGFLPLNFPPSSLLCGHMVPFMLSSLKMTWEPFYFWFLSKNFKAQLVLRQARDFFCPFWFIFDSFGVQEGSWGGWPGCHSIIHPNVPAIHL